MATAAGVSEGTNTVCSQHAGKELVYVCEDCYGTEHPLACSYCVISLHKGHKMDLLSSLVSEKALRLRNLIATAESETTSSQGEIMKRVNNELQENASQTRNCSSAIHDNADDIKKQIKENIREKIAQCKSNEKENCDALQQHKDKLEKQTADLRCYLDKCKTTIDGYNDMDVFLLDTDLSLPEIHPQPRVTTSNFHKCEDPNRLVNELCGQLSEDCKETSSDRDSVRMPYQTLSVPSPDVGTADADMIGVIREGAETIFAGPGKNRLVLSVLSSLTFPRVPRGVCACDNGSFWISGHNGMAIIHMDLTGEVRQTTKCFIQVRAMSVSPVTNHVWIAGRDQSIREIHPPQPMVLRFYVDDLPTALCMTCDDKVVVGMQYVIKLYTIFGKLLRWTGTDGLLTQVPIIPCYPSKIAECPTSHSLAIICKDSMDKTSDKKDYIQVLDAKLNRKSRLDVGNADALFDPIDVCYVQKYIAVLSASKHLLCIDVNSHIIMSARCKEEPVAMTRLNEDVLLIAHKTKSGNVVRLGK